MDFLTDSRDQFYKSYLNLFFNGLKSIISFVYLPNKSSTRTYGDCGPAPRPLMNIGLNCYLNSAFQSIAACPKFVHAMKKLEDVYPTAKNLIVFNRILSALSINSQETLKITSNEILRNWNQDGEQDTFELLSHILSQVFNELKNAKQIYYSNKVININNQTEESLPLHISMIFKIHCSLGHNSTPNMQTDLAIHLPIPFRITTEELSMEKLLDNYFIEEDISDYKCINSICKAQISKFVTLKKPLPSTLCIHLQRSFWNSNIGAMQKNNEKVKFLEKLTIKGNYFNPTRISKCVEGLFYRTFSTIVEDDKSDYFKNKNLIVKEFNELRNEIIGSEDGGDITNYKESITHDGIEHLESKSKIENISEIAESQLNLIKKKDHNVVLETHKDNFHNDREQKLENVDLYNGRTEMIIGDITNGLNQKILDVTLDDNTLYCKENWENDLKYENSDMNVKLNCGGINNLKKNTETINYKTNLDTKNAIDSEVYSGKSNNENIEDINLNYKDEEYFLKSVIIHFGNPESGHYICHRKCGDKWFCTNDTFIREVSIRDVLNSEAYILMYEKDC